MPTLYIDNKPYEVSSGKNLLEVCLSLGKDLPYFCWHPALGSVGACRQCAVKVFKDENDTKGRLVMSCMEPVTNNQRISIIDPEAHELREHVVGWLMTNHPHDCAVCDEGGACHLQDMTVMTGHAHRKFIYKKRTYENQYLGPFINHEMNRCITCYRCVRFYKDYAGGKDLDAFASRNKVYFGRQQDGVLENEFSGNLTEVCPTGVFTDKTLKQHYTRKWDLTMAPSVCQHCSLGCNIIAGERYGSLRMIGNRFNGDVNGYFICDRGRFGYEFVNSPSRIRKAYVNKKELGVDEAIKAVANQMKGGQVIGIGSARACLESNYVLQKLVGENNFYKGISESESVLNDLVKEVLFKGTAKSLSMQEIGNADAVFILGEDLTNTAPMLALAVRQAVKQQPLKKISEIGIPEWNDAAAKEYIQNEKGPIYIACVTSTKLDDVATQTLKAAPDSIARLGFMVAYYIDGSQPKVEGISSAEDALAKAIADSLLKAERPAIISGTSCGNAAMIKAASNIAQSLNKRNPKAGIALTLGECNSLGLAMLNGKSMKHAFDAVSNGGADTVIILENDLYRHGKVSDVDAFVKKCKNVIVLDHTTTKTTTESGTHIPVGTFAESDGILINNEGRAQRFVQVYKPADDILESWRWLTQLSATLQKNDIGQWNNCDDIDKAISAEIKELSEIHNVSLHADYRIEGQKIPRQPHRYSGRTAMLANINVNEPKPADDPDSPLSYTMEGSRTMPPSSMIPFFWSPGWNSVQSVNKYQEEVGGSLKGGNPGKLIFTALTNGSAKYYDSIPKTFVNESSRLLAVNIHHIFGSDEQSMNAPAIVERATKPYVLVNVEDADALKMKEGDTFSFGLDGQPYQLEVRVSIDIAKGIAGIPFGLPGMPYVELPAMIEMNVSK